MTRKLGNIASLIAGYGFRGSMPYSSFGRVRIVQAGDIHPSGRLADETTLKRVDITHLSTLALLEPGDVLLVSRSGPEGGFRAAVVQGRLGSPCLATSAITIIRPTSSEVDPGYMAAYLNSGQGQTALQRIASGSSIRSLLLKDLADIPIPTPSPQIQQTTALLVSNILSQKELIRRKHRLLDELLSTITNVK